MNCFKAYDVRGRLGADLDAGIAFRIGRAFARVLGAQRVVLGRDCRASSEELAQALGFAARKRCISQPIIWGRMAGLR
jgi:phosphomannomutase